MLVSCPYCQKGYDVEESRGGQTIQCAACCGEFIIPYDNEPDKITPSFVPQISLDSKKSAQKLTQPTHKHCPMCGEKILYVAKKCRYCQTELNGTQVVERINRFAYILLGLFFGNIGIHNIYANQWWQFAAHVILSIFAIATLAIRLECFFVVQGINAIAAILEICSDPNKTTTNNKVRKPANKKLIMFANILCIIAGIMILALLGHVIRFGFRYF